MSSDHKFHYSTQDLRHHLKDEHGISPLSSYLREIVYGGSDGIVTTFAVVAGFAGASNGEMTPTLPILTVLLFGLANLFADASSMALGNFMSTRADQDVYRENKNKERHEIKNNPRMEWLETVHILKEKGYEDEDARQMANLYQKNEKYWLDFMMNQELEMSNSEQENALATSTITATSFIVFGFVPLIPYIFFRAHPALFLISIVFTIGALFLLGVLRLRVTKVHPLRSIGEIVLLGGVSATIAYIIGSFFRI